MSGYWKRNYYLGLAVFLGILLLMPVLGFASNTEVTIWFGREDFIPGDNFETFSEEHPDIDLHVDVVPLEEVLAAYARAFGSPAQPDIIQINHHQVPVLAGRGMLMDITAIQEGWKEDDPEHYANMAEATWEMTEFEGASYGMTLHGAPYWFVYRKDLFEEAGIEPPETWDDVLDAARALRDDDMLGFSVIGSRRHNPNWFQAKFMSMGGVHIDDIPQIDSEAGIYVLEFYQTLMRENLVHPDTLAWDSGEMRAAFIGGNAAQAPIAANIYAAIQEELEYGKEWAAIVKPYRPGAKEERRYGGFSWPYVVNSEAEGKEEAIQKVFQYLARTDIVKEVALRYQPTTNMEVFEQPDYLEAQPWFEVLKGPHSEMVTVPGHLRQEEVHEILLDAMQEALSNPDRDASDIAAETQARLDLLK